MSDPKQRYTPEFKIEAVRMTLDQGHSVVDVAERLGVHSNTLYEWRRKYAADGAKAFTSEEGVKTDEKEIRELKRELDRVRQERDILKKALAYFANDKK